MGTRSSRWSTSTARTSRRCCDASAGCPRTRRSRSRGSSAPGLAAAHDRGRAAPRSEAGQRDDRRPRQRARDWTSASRSLLGTTDAVRAGTPAYMAPEQLAGREASRCGATSTRSVWCCTRCSPAAAPSRRTRWPSCCACTRATRSRVPRRIVPSLDPAIERAILRCLEHVPHERPASALAVAAALPGGDPLAAALAAGETPSPEMVAAAGRDDALATSRGGVRCAAGRDAARARAVRRSRPAPACDAATEAGGRARGSRRRHSRGARIPGGPAIAITRWTVDGPISSTSRRRDPSPERWDRLRRGRPAAVFFWQRTSPRDLVGLSIGAAPTLDGSALDRVRHDDGHHRHPGTAHGFRAVPQSSGNRTGPAAAPDWAALFTAADLPFASFTPVSPEWAPASFADTRAAWEGPVPEDPAPACASRRRRYRGRPVSFKMIWPWSRQRAWNRRRAARGTWCCLYRHGHVGVLLAAAAWLARRHLRRGRGDRQGANRVALFNVAVSAVGWVLAAHHVADFNQEVREPAPASSRWRFSRLPSSGCSIWHSSRSCASGIRARLSAGRGCCRGRFAILTSARTCWSVWWWERWSR